jgi:hypothetical protein
MGGGFVVFVSYFLSMANNPYSHNNIMNYVPLIKLFT